MSRQALRKPAMLLASLVAVLYLTYRVRFTLNLVSPYAAFASVLLLAGEVYGILTMLLYFLQIWDVSEPPRQPVLPGRTVDVFVPTYNEDPQLLRATLQACLRMYYPHRTYVLDDGRRPEVKALAEELGVGYLTRPDNEHAKAGNVNNALKQTDGEFVVILDADHVPEKHFITRLIGYFADERLGFVQTPHAFYNLDSFQASHDADRKTYWDEGAVYHSMIQPGKNRFGCPTFAGSAAMFRRRALEEVGYLAVETVTEDLHTGLRINARGWRSLAISERLIAGQAAPDVTTFHSQRSRWARGNLSILSVDNPLTMPGLTLGQRVCHFSSCIHWLGGPFRVPLYLTPPLMLFTGVAPVAELTWALLLLTALYLLAGWAAVVLASNGRFSFWNTELVEMMAFWTKTRAAVQAVVRGGGGKFVVTSKRGRQSKRVWPLVRPHLVLVLFTTLALCWGWGRCLLGLSTDWGKLLFSTPWAAFYLALAFAAIRRSLAPDDARFDYRHPVNLGLAYSVEGRGRLLGPPRLGLTLDVSDHGLGIITYEPLEPHAALQIELHGADTTLRCRGWVTWTRELSRSEGVPFRGFRSGVALESLTPGQLDVLQHLSTHYAVSRQYHDLALGRAHTAPAAAANGEARSPGRGLKGRCLECRLPLALAAPGAPGDPALCSTEAVAESGMNVLLSSPPAPGTEYAFRLGTPLGDLRGTARVLRYDILQLGGRMYFLCTLYFVEFLGGGREILAALVGTPKPGGALLTVLRPRRRRRRLPVLTPAAAIAALLLPLLAAQSVAFSWYYEDDLRLRDIAAAPALEGGETEEVQRISELTDRDRHPNTDRLLLLRRAWERVGDEAQVDRLTETLATRYPNDFELRVALLDVHVRRRDLEPVKAAFDDITNHFEYRFGPEERKRDLHVVVARACVHGGDPRAAADFFARALEHAPADGTVREEYAGILLRADQPREVLALYEGAEKGAADRFLIASAHRRLGEDAAAERECRAGLAEAPGDVSGQLLLAETLRAAGRVGEARAHYARVAAVDPSNPRLRAGLAFDAVGSGDYGRALALFRELVAEGGQRPELVRGFVDAAAGADRLAAPDRALVLRLYDQAGRAGGPDRVMLDRLAWVLQRMGDHERSASLLGRLVRAGSPGRDLRLRLAVCLSAMNRDSEAWEALAPVANDPEAMRLRAGMSLQQGDAATAEEICRERLAAAPGDAEMVGLFAITLAAGKKYDEAEDALLRLGRLRPRDRTLPVRLAEVRLWKRDYATAVARYQRLLEGALDRPALWDGFIDAAAGCDGGLTEAQRQLAVRLAGALQGSKGARVTALTRLSHVLVREKAAPGLARSLLDRAVEAPAEAATRKELAGVLAAAGMPQRAVKLYEELPLSRADQGQLAYIYVAAGEHGKAERLARGLVRNHPGDRRARRQLADVLAWSRRYDEATKAYQELLREKPGDLDLRAALARVHLGARRYDDALALYRGLLNADPGRTSHYTCYIDSAASASRIDLGEDGPIVARLVGWARRDRSEDPVLLDRLSWVCQRAQNRAAAVSLLRLALGRAPGDRQLLLRLADNLYDLGRYDEAESHYLLVVRR
jgi:cellulose synthase/poly-beta-1,6-N-acetylglucosamine synthase-like glycosyltransferase/tetratricopeptide (TPR) repeat protein